MSENQRTFRALAETNWRRVTARAARTLCERVARLSNLQLSVTPDKIAASDKATDSELRPGPHQLKLHLIVPVGLSRPMEFNVDTFNAGAVIGLYHMLPEPEKREFLRLLGKCSTAEVPFVISHELPVTEQSRYSDMMFNTIAEMVFPALLLRARQLARENPALTDDEFDKELLSQNAKFMELYDKEISERERAKFKDARERGSDPETIRRNVEICNQRAQDRKKWTLGKLARTYDVTKRAISKILAEEDKWRRLAAGINAD